MEKLKPSKPRQNEEVYKAYLLNHDSVRDVYRRRLTEAMKNIPTQHNVELELLNIEKEIKKVANKVLGKKKKYRRNKGIKIWTPDIEETIKNKQDAYKRYLSNPTEENNEIYVNKRNTTKSKVIKAHQESWKRFAANIEHDLYGRQSVAYTVFKRLKQSEKDKISINNIEEEQWAKHYKDSSEIEASKNRKATGIDGIITELIKYEEQKWHQYSKKVTKPRSITTAVLAY